MSDRAYNRDWDQKNKDRLKWKQQQWREERKKKILQVIGDGKCKDCGLDDFRVLEY